MVEFHRKVKTIHKDGQAQYGKYATLQSVLAAITPALCDCGLFVSQQLTTTDTLLTVLRHVGGECIESETPLQVSTGKNLLHSWGGAVTYQRRYALLAILGMAAGIDDDDGQSAGIVKMPKTSVTSNDDDFL
jgi:hypothetical protein